MDFRFAELCNFDQFCFSQVLELNVSDPFRITLINGCCKVLIEALEDIEWIKMNGSEDGPFIINSGCKKYFEIQDEMIDGSFRLLKDKTGKIFNYKWNDTHL